MTLIEMYEVVLVAGLQMIEECTAVPGGARLRDPTDDISRASPFSLIGYR